ncbi:MAG: aldehyde dehydrogenase family protein [Actinomycetota bacterium]
MLRPGDRVLVGTSLITVDEGFASLLRSGDRVLGIEATGQLRRVPAAVSAVVDDALILATSAFERMSTVDQQSVTLFYRRAAALLADDGVFERVRSANAADVDTARTRGRSTTRLVLSDAMRAGMIEALSMWSDTAEGETELSSVSHPGWEVTEHRAPLGVIGFVFEGRPNVFADATGVLRGGNTVVFRIGSDALGTARELMASVVRPALEESGLPAGAVCLLDSAEHAAGWALFADSRLSLAVARGSGPAVAELGSIARQAGTPVSLHGTGGAWMIVGESVDAARLSAVVESSLDRKVCNTLNVICLPSSRAAELVPLVEDAADRAASVRGVRARIHSCDSAVPYFRHTGPIEVRRAGGSVTEPRVTTDGRTSLGHEFEWEENPEFRVEIVGSVGEAITLFNAHSPRFIVSCVSTDDTDHDAVWSGCDAPFVGDGFTRWVDGQFALLRPELGLSNWQTGRLFARSAILSGDSGYSVRLRVRQDDPRLHR